ncbi:MAG: prepilin-type N-terminal cleavage/methylation domain-containing protein [Pirellulales bacterium]|nr:prepilin-type N-terminal cleavage/methylation domain-containing protein [Pirellulales bacterium]
MAATAGSRGSRRGISLLEVLISVFVLSVGLLGLAALIPVGRFAIVETGKADRGGACGRAGLRELKIRGMLDPQNWRQYADPDNGDYSLASVVNNPTVARGESFAIDPLSFGRLLPGDAAIHRFPYAPLAAQPASQLRGTNMQRVTLAGVGASLPLADRIFTWQDDLLFARPEDRDLRPRAQLGTTTGRQEIEGDYSWLVTVTPARSEIDLPVQQRQLYSVSVVVFYKRQYPADRPINASDPKPTERKVVANILTDGYGGGDVRLTTDHGVEYLDVREDEWLMLCGRVTHRDSSPAVYPSSGVFQWYRVVAAGDVYQATDGSGNLMTVPSTTRPVLARDVTLAGPDWNTRWCACDDSGTYTDSNGDMFVDLDGDGWEWDAEAALMDGVIGVYSTTVELDWNLLWNR